MPRGKRTATDTTMLSMALVGYELEKQKIDEKIQEIRSVLGSQAAPAKRAYKRRKATGSASIDAVPAEGRKRRTLSAAARKRIAIAQRKRWAEHRKKLAAAAK
jgi:hypothetical protein